ncbi:MAG: hypothetical protein H6624_08290 [Bdellovibrionaceae bacterium]|nr:hypothetical protein [Bdellovibrionales bacterium]MCB9084331.1 hypothetical protein [Pseudobdellovibrionaceae bacterium]
MKSVILVLSLACSSLAFASSQDYEIFLRFYADGKLITSPTMTSVKGEQIELVQTSTDLNRTFKTKIMASDREHPNIKDAIHLDVEMEFEMNKTKYKSKSEILLQPGNEGTIKAISPEGKETLSLKVVAKRR